MEKPGNESSSISSSTVITGGDVYTMSREITPSKDMADQSPSYHTPFTSKVISPPSDVSLCSNVVALRFSPHISKK